MNGISASPFSNDLLWLTLLTQGESVRVFWPAVSSAVFNILVVRGPPRICIVNIEKGFRQNEPKVSKVKVFYGHIIKSFFFQTS